MAYTCVRVAFEIGHEAVVRPKKTQQGFTHDWELFIRGADNTDIQHFVDKVVFHLHDTFQNPKRVVKEAPYSIRESGYAGFMLVVEVYLKNKLPAEPNKIRFNYHLTLQEIDQPPLTIVSKETYVFSNPSEDFRRKLIKGGGVGVGANSTSGSHSSHMALNSNHAADDHKTSGNKSRPSPQEIAKKSKKESSSKHEELLNQNDPFSIFGAPIIKNKIPYTTSKSNSKPISDKTSQPTDKQAHSSSKSSKHNSSSHKDKDRDKDKEKEREKEKSKERDKEKEKSSSLKKSKDEAAVKKDKNKDDKDKTLKSSKEESKMKNLYHDEKQKEKEKSVEKSEKEFKADKKDKEKKHKDDKKLKSKEKHKNDNKKENIGVHENYAERTEKSALTKEDVPLLKEEKKVHKLASEDKEEKLSKDKSGELKSSYNNGSLNVLNTNNQSAVSNLDSLKKEEKHKHHKHKKDKSKKDSKRDKEEKKEKSKDARESKEKSVPIQTEQPKSTPKSDSPKRLKKPLKTLFDELSDKSDSDSSSDDDMNVSTLREPEPEPESPPELSQQSLKEDTMVCSRQEDQSKEERLDSSSKKKNKKSTEDKESKKRKRKSKHKDENTVIKMSKYDEHTTDGLKQTATILDMQQAPRPRPTSVSPVSETKFTDEYITKLKELQRKIMSLDDNSGLQRIVQVVAETGQYEITTKTFDFDLCTLDESIVQRLLDFFVP